LTEKSGIAKHPAWAIVGVVATVVGTIFAGIALLRPSGSEANNSLSNPGTTSTSSGPIHSGAGSGGSASATPSKVFAAGTCVNGDAVTGCDSMHTSETYAADTCDLTSFTSYAGGDPTVDVLRPGAVSVRPGGTAKLCRAELSAPMSQSAKDLLSSHSGDFLRLCFQSDGGRVAGCDQPHTSEATFHRLPGDAVDANCPGRAERYLGAPLSRFAQSLRSEQRDEPTGTYCWVTTLGSNKLTAAVRGVGYNALPLSSA
jgi:hypothetical protein